MAVLSPKQREIQQREILILGAARQMLLDDGYYGLTMDRVADASTCPKGTMYQHFRCKEDIILTLARQAMDRRMALIQRGAAYPGRSRERMGGVGEGMALFMRLTPGDGRVIRVATGTTREKASPDRVAAVVEAELATAEFIAGILRDAVADGDLVPRDETTVVEVTFALLSLVDGAYSLIEGGVPRNLLGMLDPAYDLWRVYNLLADAYGWRPLFAEHDWEETLADIRRTVFPEEAQRLYGEGAWYGGAGSSHPGGMEAQLRHVRSTGMRP